MHKNGEILLARAMSLAYVLQQFLFFCSAKILLNLANRFQTNFRETSETGVVSFSSQIFEFLSVGGQEGVKNHQKNQNAG